jgi:hypothetical protein
LLEYLKDKPSIWLAYWGTNQDHLLDFFVEHGYVRTATQMELHREEQIFVYRYDRPGDQTLATFGGLFELKRVDLSASEINPGDTLRVNLLFKAFKQPPVDYSISVFLLDSSGNSVTQNDSSPFEGRAPTSDWQAGDVKFDSHSLTANLAPGEYQVGGKIYWYADPKPLSVTGADTGTSNYFLTGKIIVTAP